MSICESYKVAMLSCSEIKYIVTCNVRSSTPIYVRNGSVIKINMTSLNVDQVEITRESLET